MKKRQMMAAAVCLAVMAAFPCYGAQEDALFLESSGEEAVQEEESQVATEDEMAPKEEVLEDGMVPIYGKDIKDGEYQVEIVSSSSMFKITDATLTVKDGEMKALMTMSGTGYLRLFMGTGEKAVQASEEEYIPFVENEKGEHTFEIPVEALDDAIDCAAFSKRKQKWYDRVLVVKASSLPMDAFLNTEMTEVSSLGLEDGVYQVEVKLEGGSGRTKIESPAALHVKDGKATASVILGSPHFDYMIIDGSRYTSVTSEDSAVFEIPVITMDWEIPVSIDTVALGKPHEISYTLEFVSSSIEKEE